MSPGLRKRLPILVVVVLGLWLWRSPLFPQPRTFVWDRPLGPPVASAEVQLWREGDLVSRVEWPDATRGTLSQELTLRRGQYRIFTFARMGDGTARQGEQTLSLGSETVVHAPLLPAVPDGHPLTGPEHGQ
jgi:hypothetical protein